MKTICEFDNYDLSSFATIAANFGNDRYGYVVTPNTDHLLRMHESDVYRSLYTQATYSLLDSRFLAHFLRVSKGLRLPVCAGSDLTAKLFADVIAPSDRVVLIGCSDTQVRMLRDRFGLKDLVHYNPPMGFIEDADAVETCLQFIEAQSPFRFCLLAVGAPQQEILAQRLRERGIARGLALCIGASIDFLTGKEKRAPRWMQSTGFEWLFRLLQAPRRMASRYLIRGPRIFLLLRKAEIILRPART